MTTGLALSPISGPTTGKTVLVTANATPTSVAGSISLPSPIIAPNLRICNNGSVVVFVRVSAEASPTATAADLPIPAGQSFIVQNPVPTGTVGLAVLSSTTTACPVYFTPCMGGT